jgi:DNA-directed RNA polymerase subunit RPC12/RpoP
MPLRAYACEKCKTMTEDLYWNDYPSSIKCPTCGSKAVYRFVDSYYKKLGDRQPKRYKVTFREGYDVGAGKYFSTQKDRDRYCHETDCTLRKDCW